MNGQGEAKYGISLSTSTSTSTGRYEISRDAANLMKNWLQQPLCGNQRENVSFHPLSSVPLITYYFISHTFIPTKIPCNHQSDSTTTGLVADLLSCISE
jgi:hypothetical protein